MTEPIQLNAEIGVGSLVRLRTEQEPRRKWVVVEVGRWPMRGRLKIVCRASVLWEWTKWVYPAEVEPWQPSRA